MQNTAIIRSENKRTIYYAMLDGGSYTKNQIASMTGLSIPTCNTLLNLLAEEGLVQPDEKICGSVGRNSLTYRIDDTHEYYLAIHFSMMKGIRSIEYLVFSPEGHIVEQERMEYEQLTLSAIEAAVQNALSRFPAISQIIAGTPSFISNGRIHHSDIPEMDDIFLSEHLEKMTGLPVTMKNDMHFKAYGYAKLKHCQNEVVSLACFPSGVFPGTVTIHKGDIIEGSNGAAGMTGFLACHTDKKELLKQWNGENAIPLIGQTIRALIVLMNPGRIVFCGDLIHEQIISEIKQKYLHLIPQEYMPIFEISDHFNTFYYEGMYQIAVKNKKF